MVSEYKKLKRRYVGLDVLRVISAFMVCAFHTTAHLGADYGVFQAVSQMGAVFMTAFFMLSGFSLFVNHAGEDLIQVDHLRRFWIKRIIGIIPMYYIVALLRVVTDAIAGKCSIMESVMLAPIEALCAQSIFATLFGVSHNGGTWFISCIIICYLVYPFIQEIVKQLSPKAMMGIIIICAFLLLYSPFIVWKFDTVSIYANPFFRLLEFAIGIMLGALKPLMDKIRFIKRYVCNWICVAVVGIAMGGGYYCSCET